LGFENELMTDRGKTAKGTTDLCVGEVIGFGATFVRYVILARFLGAADFGIAATFILTVQVLQTVSNMALNMLIVQSRDGDDLSLQATAHSLQVLRGVVSAALVLALAWPISALFGIPHALWGLQALAIVPLLEGFAHLDMHRMERHMHFRPSIMVGAVPKLITALAAWPVAAWLTDYSAALWLLIGQGVAGLLVSHAVAKHPYRLAWNRRYVAEILGFGWPLLLNGVLFFGVSQGDRVIVGTAYTMTDLGIYSVSAGFVITLSASLFRVINTLSLPPLARAQDDPGEFVRRYGICSMAFSLMAAVCGAFLIVAGEPLVVLFYGEPYRAAGVLVGWLAAAQSMRVLRLGPSIAAMAKGDTQCLMYANVFRVSGLVAAAGAAFAGAPLAWIAAAAVLGEAVALPIPVIRLRKRYHLPTGVWLRPASAAMAAIVFSALLVAAGARNATIVVVLTTVLIAGAALTVWGVVAFPSLRERLLLVYGLLGLSAGACTEKTSGEQEVDEH
jgi:O-antigen/teichoic acid export membrane protein